MTKNSKWRGGLFPTKLSKVVEKITKPAFQKNGLVSSRIVTDWVSIVGPRMAAYSIPTRINFPPGKKVGGTLTIAVQSGFATELQHMQLVILEQLATYFGYRAVTKITISHTFTKKPNRAPVSQETRKPVALQGAEHAIEKVEDEKLRTSLLGLAQALQDK